MDVIINHRQQPESFGCMYYAASAYCHTLVDDDLRDTDEARFFARMLHHKNMLFVPVFEGRYTDQVFTAEGWERARSIAQAHKWPRVAFLVTIPSPRMAGNHMVAVQVQSRRDGEAVHISDPALPGLLRMTWPEFLKSPYSAAVQVLTAQKRPVLP